MIGRIFGKHIVKKISENKKPTLNHKQCINNLQKHEKCDLCIKTCPQNAIDLENFNIIDEKCDNCNICVAVCNAGAFIPMRETLEKQYNIINSQNEITFACNKSCNDTDLSAECIAAIPWELFAYVCIDKKMIISTKACKNCRNINLIKAKDRNISLLKRFLSTNNQNLIITNDDIKTREYSRREMFMAIGNSSKNMLGFVIPIDFDNNISSRIYRQMLVSKISTKNDKYIWHGFSPKENCWACNACSIVCPQKAIKISGKNKRIFTHDYKRCTNCMLCATVCIENAIESVDIYASANQSLKKYETDGCICSVCGDAISFIEENPCLLCTRKMK